MKFRNKPVIREATQWFKNGDHPKDECQKTVPVPVDGEPYLTEGKVVRYYRHPKIGGEQVCTGCGFPLYKHGWIDTLEGGHIVCVGDWIITGVRGENYPCKPDIFEATYEAVE